MLRRPRTSHVRQAVLAAAVLASAASLLAPAAEAQVAPAEVTVTGSSLEVQAAIDCRGDLSGASDQGTFTVARSGDTTAALEVDVTYGGDLTDGLPDPVTIPAGQASATVRTAFTVEATTTLDLEAGAGYTVGTPGAATATVVPVIEFEPACDHAVEQTFAVGTAPDPIDFEALGMATPYMQKSNLEIEGTLPPGITPGPSQALTGTGDWTGVATTVGTYTFQMYWCWEGSCMEELDVTFRVVADATDPLPLPAPVPPPAPAPAPAPARPLPGQPTFTG